MVAERVRWRDRDGVQKVDFARIAVDAGVGEIAAP
jgi:hypothetical protein